MVLCNSHARVVCISKQWKNLTIAHKIMDYQLIECSTSNKDQTSNLISLSSMGNCMSSPKRIIRSMIDMG